ncbi:MAG TPA: hypothetical protein H9788_14110 [Candidatus Brevibacterium intestinavium]|jgi:hypothetical protein|nr:hypothetical protein [Candidatus Brevibacterium intestinavium]
MLKTLSLRAAALTFVLAVSASLGVNAVNVDSADAACLKVTKWYSKPGKYDIDKRYVSVKNSCSSAKKFKIDIKHRPDKGPYTAPAKSTKSHFYANNRTPQGRGIYEAK